MSTRRTETGLLGALRREAAAFAVLGLVLLLAQIFVAGMQQGAMASGRFGPAGLSVLCHPDGAEAPATGHRAGTLPDCPCLAGACSASAGLLAADEASPLPAVHRAAGGANGAAKRPDGIDRRPLTLFARAGRGPPEVS